jgi:hypothetical protein
VLVSEEREKAVSVSDTAFRLLLLDRYFAELEDRRSRIPFEEEAAAAFAAGIVSWLFEETLPYERLVAFSYPSIRCHGGAVGDISRLVAEQFVQERWCGHDESFRLSLGCQRRAVSDTGRKKPP